MGGEGGEFDLLEVGVDVGFVGGVVFDFDAVEEAAVEGGGVDAGGVVAAAVGGREAGVAGVEGWAEEVVAWCGVVHAAEAVVVALEAAGRVQLKWERGLGSALTDQRSRKSRICRVGKEGR